MSGTATKFYLMQKVTGAVIIPVSIWILFYLLPNIGCMIFNNSKLESTQLQKIFGGTHNITYMIIFIACGLYHGILGMQSVIQDYIHCSVMKKILLTVIYGCAIFAVVFLTIFSIDMHMKVVNSYKINESRL